MLKQISRYEIKKEIGRGGMAVVYLGHDPQFNRPVAIKVLPKQLMFDSSFRSRFKREAEVIASLEHAAIVPVYDYGEEDEQPYLVMRYMPGGSLRDRIKKGKLSLEESATLLKRIAPALDKAHRRGIVHRDIKPENILFDEEGEAYISDFGIAKITENSTGLTGSAIIGTPAYMSPEQALGKNQVDGRSDLYSLGVTLFEALASQELFKADTPMGLAMAHINEAPQSITSRRKDLPVAIDAILDKVLSKKPSERYASAKEFAEGFAGVSNSKTIGQAKPAPKTVALPKKRRSKQTQATDTYQQGRSTERKTTPAGHKRKWYENTAVWFAAAALLILFLYLVWLDQPDAGTNAAAIATAPAINQIAVAPATAVPTNTRVPTQAPSFAGTWNNKTSDGNSTYTDRITFSISGNIIGGTTSWAGFTYTFVGTLSNGGQEASGGWSSTLPSTGNWSATLLNDQFIGNIGSGWSFCGWRGADDEPSSCMGP